MKHRSFFVTLSILTICVGCAGVKKPADLPKLHPCTVSIDMNGAPLEGALVTLVPDSGKWSAAGTTDATGSVDLYTRNFRGIPEGSYRVTVQKFQTSASSSSADEEDRTTGYSPQGEKLPPPSLVDKKFSGSTSSPLKCDVVAGKNFFKFSVEPPK